MDWQQIVLFAILGLGAGSLIAGIAIGIVLFYRGSGIINLSTGAVRQGRRERQYADILARLRTPHDGSGRRQKCSDYCWKGLQV